MGFFKKLFGIPDTLKSEDIAGGGQTSSAAEPRFSVRRDPELPYLADNDYLRLFCSVPEVFFPIDFIASRIAKAHFEVKRSKDDSIVWCNRKMDKIFSNPNCMMTWSELIYTHVVHSLATGNGFIRAAMSESAKDCAKYRWCNSFWPIPPDSVTAVPPSYNLPIYGVCSMEDLVDHYNVSVAMTGLVEVPTWQMWHDRDLSADMVHGGIRYTKSKSRLDSVIKPISNICAVYDARNVIYTKRGGIGFLVSQKTDETGTVAMDPDERKQILDYLTKTYGVGEGQYPMGVTDVPLSFVRTNLSIAELQPFEETLLDAVTIAGAFGIPDVLVPRKDHSTFSNQATAEKSAYTGVIIPMAQKLCQGLTTFFGLDRDGLYLDCNFNDVDCLQVGLKEAEEVKKLVNDRCRRQFLDGLITLNDWRAQIHESAIEEEGMPFFSKLRFQMDAAELAAVAAIISETQNTKLQTPTTNVEHEREEEKPGLSD